VASPCDIADALAEAQFYILRKINARFESLRRLATLLEQLGNLQSLVPNLTRLIPVVSIDVTAYTNLATACPFLGLPVVTDANLHELRDRVVGAYNTLMQDVLNHSWMRMGMLQDNLTKYRDQVNAAFAEGQGYLQCLQAACQAVSSLQSRLSMDVINAEFSKYNRNYIEEAGQILTEPARAKYSEAVQVATTLRDLGATLPLDVVDMSQVAVTAATAGNVSVLP